MAAKPKVLYSKTIGAFRVDFIARRGEYDCNVVDVASGATVKALCYPKLGRGHSTEWLDACAEEAVIIAHRAG